MCVDRRVGHTVGHSARNTRWGLTIGTGDEPSRLLVTAADMAALEPTDSLVGRWLAVTGCHIRTLRSTQLKGPVMSVEPPTELDEARADRYCNAYFDAVAEVDNSPRRLMERMRARAVVALTFRFVEVYDQTPGPVPVPPSPSRADDRPNPGRSEPML